MEHLHMNQLRDLMHRLRAGESERRIARDMSLSRTTVRNLRSRTGRAARLSAARARPAR